MPKYELIYDYCNEDGYEERNIVEEFDGPWYELNDYIKVLRKNGCYNICAEQIGGFNL